MSIRTKVGFSFVLLLIVATGAIITFASKVFYQDKIQFLRVSNSENAQTAGQLFLQTTRQIYQDAFVQVRALTQKSSDTALFEPPFDYLAALAVLSTKQGKTEVLHAAVQPQMAARLKWDRAEWTKAAASISVANISSKQSSIQRLARKGSELLVLGFPLKLQKSEPGVLLVSVLAETLLSRMRGSSATDNVTYFLQNESVLFHPWAALNQRPVTSPDLQRLLKTYRDSEAGTGGFEGAGLDGRAIVGGFYWVPTFQVMAVTETDRHAALSAYRAMIYRIGLIAFLVIAGGLLLAAWLTRKLTDPIQELTEATREIATGHFSARIEANVDDEVGDMAQAFNVMAEELSEREGRILQQQADLVQSEKMAAFGQLGSGIAHELKNPLAGVLGNAQLLGMKDPVKSDPKLKNYIDVIEQEVKRTQGILDSFAQFTKREKLILMPNPVSEVVKGAVALAEHHLQLGKIKLNVSIASDIPPVLCQSGHIQQILLQLLLNAKEAQPNGGAVNVSVRQDGVDGHERVLIEVHDEVSRSGQELEQQSTDLGFTVAQAIMEDHGGEIRVESLSGKGTTVTLSLRVAAVDEVPLPSFLPPPPPTTRASVPQNVPDIPFPPAPKRVPTVEVSEIPIPRAPVAASSSAGAEVFRVAPPRTVMRPRYSTGNFRVRKLQPRLRAPEIKW